MNDFEKFVEYINGFHKYASGVVEAKNADYAGKTEPLRNFEDAALIAGVTVEQGLLVRMADKLARIRNLTAKKDSVGEVGEKIEDTLMDLSNYAAILSYYCKENYESHEYVQEETPNFPDIPPVPVVLTLESEPKEKRNWFKDFVGV
jgi:hypothetical protein